MKQSRLIQRPSLRFTAEGLQIKPLPKTHRKCQSTLNDDRFQTTLNETDPWITELDLPSSAQNSRNNDVANFQTQKQQEYYPLSIKKLDLDLVQLNSEFKPRIQTSEDIKKRKPIKNLKLKNLIDLSRISETPKVPVLNLDAMKSPIYSNPEKPSIQAQKEFLNLIQNQTKNPTTVKREEKVSALTFQKPRILTPTSYHVTFKNISARTRVETEIVSQDQPTENIVKPEFREILTENASTRNKYKSVVKRDSNHYKQILDISSWFKNQPNKKIESTQKIDSSEINLTESIRIEPYRTRTKTSMIQFKNLDPEIEKGETEITQTSEIFEIVYKPKEPRSLTPIYVKRPVVRSKSVFKNNQMYFLDPINGNQERQFVLTENLPNNRQFIEKMKKQKLLDWQLKMSYNMHNIRNNLKHSYFEKTGQNPKKIARKKEIQEITSNQVQISEDECPVRPNFKKLVKLLDNNIISKQNASLIHTQQLFNFKIHTNPTKNHFKNTDVLTKIFDIEKRNLPQKSPDIQYDLNRTILGQNKEIKPKKLLKLSRFQDFCLQIQMLALSKIVNFGIKLELENTVLQKIQAKTNIDKFKFFAKPEKSIKFYEKYQFREDYFNCAKMVKFCSYDTEHHKNLKNFAEKSRKLPPFIEEYDTLILTDKLIVSFEAICQYISKSKIKNIVIDGFQMNYLDQVLEQFENREIENLTIQNQKIKNFNRLIPFLRQSYSFVLNNIKCPNIQDMLTQTVFPQKPNILKIQLTNIDLSTWDFRGLLLATLPCLLELDISWSKIDLSVFLSCHQEIVKSEFIICPLRCLNISYNPTGSNLCVILNQYLSDPDMCTNLTHFGISGVKMGQQQIIKLCKSLYKCPNMLGVHMSDIGICQVQEKVKEVFGIQEEKGYQERYKVQETNNDKLKEYIELKQIRLQKQSNFGRNSNETNLDNFVLTKIFNPELQIFGQQIWRYNSEKLNDCYQCQKSKYTLIFFESEVGTPYIFGTFVPKTPMLRADYFALLAVSENADFFKNASESRTVKSVVQKIYLSNQKTPRRDRWLKGWNIILDKLCFSNDITEPLVINSQGFSALPEKPNQNLFVFAAYIEPGFHQFTIQDGQNTFIKDIIVDQRTQYIYPELPPKIKDNKMKQKSVFYGWPKDDIKRQGVGYLNDMETQADGVDHFRPEFYIKNKRELRECEEIIRKNYYVFLTVFKEMQAKSNQYPLVDADCFQSIFPSAKVTKAMNRGQFIDQTLKIAYKLGQRNSSGISDIFEELIQSLADKCQQSKVCSERLLIHQDKKLSGVFLELDFDSIYSEPYTLESAKEMFSLETECLREAFIFSKQTILNEHMDSRLYEKLSYIEFLEFFARVAMRMEGLENLSLDQKVSQMFESIKQI